MALVLLASMSVIRPVAAARLAEFLAGVAAADIFPGADRIGPPQGEPPLAPVYAGDTLLGQVWLNTDVTDATGYSGKPIRLLVTADTAGAIRGIRLVEHKEPIVLLGIPVQRVVAAVNSLVGTAIGPVARGQARPPQTDIVSGATVTVLVMADSVVRSAVRLLRAGRLGEPPVAVAPRRAPSPQPLPRSRPAPARCATGRACWAMAPCAACISRSGR